MNDKYKQTQCNALGYRIDLYYHDYKLAIETDENRHDSRNIDYKIKRQKTILLELVLTKKTLIFLQLSMKYLDKSNNQLKISNR